ncbi:hypothetical protein [Marinicella sp. W31]|uniref:hypothetical protein n=1 Tax=Marinicella sp. W31 TaxID=3023713 RepID=UPI00375638DC
MKIRSIRFCSVTPEAEQFISFMNNLGVEQRHFEEAAGCVGGIFPAEDGSWVEIWQEGEGMPAGVMLQLVVDDADAMATLAKSNGLEPSGPMDAHGERIYHLQTPAGIAMSFQSALDSD